MEKWLIDFLNETARTLYEWTLGAFALFCVERICEKLFKVDIFLFLIRRKRKAKAKPQTERFKYPIAPIIPIEGSGSA
jgi:hypothetical protein